MCPQDKMTAPDLQVSEQDDLVGGILDLFWSDAQRVEALVLEDDDRQRLLEPVCYAITNVAQGLADLDHAGSGEAYHARMHFHYLLGLVSARYHGSGLAGDARNGHRALVRRTA